MTIAFAVVAAGCASAVPVAGARTLRATPSPAPSRAQVARAVRSATHSSYLWATVNICTRRAHGGGVMGVRGEMPGLGFAVTETMAIQLRQYNARTHAYSAVRGATARHTATLGTVRSGVQQDGAEFPYRADTGRLEAAVTFTWTRAGRTLAQVTRVTSGGHPSAAYGKPAHYSAPTCRL